MSDNYEQSDLYFENLSAEQISYLELLESKHTTYYDTKSTLHAANPLHKHEFLQNHVAYMDGDEAADFRIATEQYDSAKYSALAVFGGTLAAHCVYKLATSPKTARMGRFVAQGALLGFFSAGIYMGYAHKRLSDTLGELFASVMQKKMRERSRLAR